MSVLAVDLGTSNTVAVLSAHGRAPRVVEVDGSATMPSAVFAADDGRLVVGREAERRARLNPARFEPNPKRRVDEGTLLLGDRVVPVSEAFAAVLGKVAEETSRQLGGSRADEVRLTHPAQWGPVRRNVLLSAARQAGLGSNLVLIPEPVAAAAHFASFPGRTLTPGQALAVYDLGAGTFDVAIVGVTQTGFTVLAEAGLPDLGGLDVDQALLQHVGTQVSHLDPHAWQRLMMPQSTADRRAQRALREDVRAAKEALSGHPQTDMPLPEPFHDVLITRAELESLIRPNLIRSAELLANTVRQAGLSPDRLAGIYLVGGSSRIPLVATLISEQLRIVPTNLDQPETAVALGTHHVPRESTSLRTESITTRPTPGADAVAMPRPPVQLVAQQPGLVDQIESTPTANSMGSATKNRNSTKWWLTGVAAVAIVAIVTVLAVQKFGNGTRQDASKQAPSATTEAPSTEEALAELGITIDRPKVIDPSILESIDCATQFPLDEMSSATGLQVSNGGVAPAGGCDYRFELGSGETVSASMKFELSRSYVSYADLTEIDLAENSTFEETGEIYDCTIMIALRQVDRDALFFVANMLDHQTAEVDSCDIGRKISKRVFDNLPDA